MAPKRYTGKNTHFYLTSEKVADTINLSIALKRPILVEGEPGCGKTQLAYSIAAELNLGQPYKISVKSTSRATDLLYRFDALRRLQDAQNPENEHAKYLYPYFSLGILGKALHQKQRSVVLIDEIDKADIDYPNDLLDVLDTFSFIIEDLPEEEEKLCLNEKGFGRAVTAQSETRPIIIITSNREKRLPEPFLRRCIFIRLKFPTSVEELRNMVLMNLKVKPEHLEQSILESAVAAFLRVRNLAIKNDLHKPPSTSELIDWVKILYWKGETTESIQSDPYLPPYWELLFKNMSDLDLYAGVSKEK